MCELPLSERSALLHFYTATAANESANPSSYDSEIQQSSNTTNENESRRCKQSSISVIIFGQVIALSLACGNAASSALQNQYQLHIPTCLTGVVYLVLSLHILWLIWEQRTTEDKKKRYQFPLTRLQMYTPWYIYLLLAILDVEANYLAMLSFQQTTLSSSMLLTSLSILSTVLLRKLVFGSNIRGKAKLFGVLMCILGGCLCLQEDVHNTHIKSDRDLSHDSPPIYLHGDLLALVAAFLYGLNDVLAEYFVKANNDRVEYLGMLGLFGSLFSFCVQAPLLERDAVLDLLSRFGKGSITGADMSNISDTPFLFLLFGFVTMLSFFYVAVSLFLSKNDATILNLSLQSCPLWAVVLATVAEIFTKGEMSWFPRPLYFVALILVVAGTFSYESAEDDGHSELPGGCSVEYCGSKDSLEVNESSPNRYRIDEFIP
jgi:solute carrier family 35 protein F1/2